MHLLLVLIAPSVITKWISLRDLHRFNVDHGDGAGTLLEDLIDGAFAVGDCLFRRAAEIDVPEHRPILRVNHHQALRRMAADIDAIVGGVAVDTVGAESLWNFNRLDQLAVLMSSNIEGCKVTRSRAPWPGIPPCRCRQFRESLRPTPVCRDRRSSDAFRQRVPRFGCRIFVATAPTLRRADGVQPLLLYCNQ